MSKLTPFCFGQPKLGPENAVNRRSEGPEFRDKHGFFRCYFAVGEYDITQSAGQAFKLIVIKLRDCVDGRGKAFPVWSGARHDHGQLVQGLDSDVAAGSLRDVRLLDLIFDVTTNHVQFSGVQNFVATGSGNQETQLIFKRLADSLRCLECFRMCRINLLTWPFSRRVKISDVQKHRFAKERVRFYDLTNIAYEALDTIAAKRANGSALMANGCQHGGVWPGAYFDQRDPPARLVSLCVTVVDDAINRFEVCLSFGIRLLSGDHLGVIIIAGRLRNVRACLDLRQSRRWRFNGGRSSREPSQKQHTKIHSLELHGEVEHRCPILATEGCLA